MYTKSNLIEKTITLVKVEENGNQVKITDENNNFYSFFKTKKGDGGLTLAAVDIQQFGLGQQVNVVYEERTGTSGGTFRNVARIKPAGGTVTTTPATQTPPAQNTTAPVNYNASLPKDVSITAQAFAKSLLESHQATPQDLVNPQWWATTIFPAISAMVTAGLAVPQADEDINVDDIPF